MFPYVFYRIAETFVWVNFLITSQWLRHITFVWLLRYCKQNITHMLIILNDLFFPKIRTVFVDRLRHKVYKPFNFVAPDCTPESHGRRVAFFSFVFILCIYFLFHVHSLLAINALTFLFDVSVFLALKCA